MKTLFKSTLFAAALFVAAQAHAQTHKDSTLGHKVGVTAKKVGHKTSELASKGSSDVIDKQYKGKCGPHGETVYINNHSQYYMVDKKGHRVYLKKSELMDKKM